MIRTVTSQSNLTHMILSAYKQNTASGKSNVPLHIGTGKASSSYNYVIEAPLMKKIELKDNSRKLVMSETEFADIQNDLYRNSKSTSISRLGYTSGILDLSSLAANTNQESCFQGSISNTEDVDYYYINAMSQMISKRPIYVTMEAPEGSGCRMTVYDKDGNQVGISKPNEDGTQTLEIPCDWSSSNGFTLKIEGTGMNGENTEIPYKLRFKQGEMDPELKAFLERNRKKKVYETPAEGNRTDDDSKGRISEMLGLGREDNHVKIKELHEKQYEALPIEKQYHGEETIEELLSRKRNGEELTEAEKAYLEIYGNLEELADTEYDISVRKTFEQLKDALWEAGIDISLGIHLEISPDGNVTVSGLSGEENRMAADIIKKNGLWSGLKNGYLAKSETVKGMNASQYKTALFTDELNRILQKASGGRITVDDIRRIDRNKGGIVTDYYLEGLPEPLDRLINNPAQDSIYEEYNSMLYYVLAHRELSQESPEFHVQMDIDSNGIRFI